MRWLVVLALALLALGAAGCGGSDGSGSADEAVATETTAETVAEETMTTEETTSTDTTSSGGTTGGLEGVLSDECAELVNLSATFAEAFSSASSGQTADLDRSAEFFEQFADKVPEEIRDDFQIVAENFTKIVEALKDVGPISASSSAEDLAQAVQKLQEATKDIDQAEVNAAATRIGAWANANCNVGG
jgi:hypothetical protein